MRSAQPSGSHRIGADGLPDAAHRLNRVKAVASEVCSFTPRKTALARAPPPIEHGMADKRQGCTVAPLNSPGQSINFPTSQAPSPRPSEGRAARRWHEPRPNGNLGEKVLDKIRDEPLAQSKMISGLLDLKSESCSDSNI
jgi:hypothetical protein